MSVLLIIKLTLPSLERIGNISSSVYVNDAETLNYLRMNKHALRYCVLESQNEFEGKDIFYSEKKARERHKLKTIDWAHKVAAGKGSVKNFV